MIFLNWTAITLIGKYIVTAVYIYYLYKVLKKKERVILHQLNAMHYPEAPPNLILWNWLRNQFLCGLISLYQCPYTFSPIVFCYKKNPLLQKSMFGLHNEGIANIYWPDQPTYHLKVMTPKSEVNSMANYDYHNYIHTELFKMRNISTICILSNTSINSLF